MFGMTSCTRCEAARPRRRAFAKLALIALSPALLGAPARAQTSSEVPQIQLIYQQWAKYCMKGAEANAKQVCFVGADGRVDAGQTVVAVVIIMPDGEPKKILRVTLPLGMALVQGTRVVIDSNKPEAAPFVACFQNGCMADYDFTPELLASMKKGQNLFVQSIQVNGSPVTLPIPLKEFAKAFDGPPTDPKVFEENQKKLQEEVEKRAARSRAKDAK